MPELPAIAENEKTTAILQRIRQDYDFAKAERDQHTSDWDNWRLQFDSEWSELEKEQADENLDQWLFVPKTRSQVHRVECSLLAHFFPQGRTKLFKATPTVLQGMIPKACTMLDALLHAKVDMECGPEEAYGEAIRTALVEGQGVLKAGWTRVRGGNRPDLSHVPNQHVMWDPYALRQSDISFFIQEVWVTVDELWQRLQAGVYENVEQVIKEASNETADDPWREGKAGPDNKERGLIKLIEFWGPQQLVPDRKIEGEHRLGKHILAQDIVATTYKDKVLLRMKPNRYAKMMKNPTPKEKLPYFLLMVLPRPGETYGDSFCDLIRDVQREINNMHNNRRLVTDLELGSKVAYDETRIMDKKALRESRYAGFIPVQGPPAGALEWFHPQTSTTQMYLEEQGLDALMREVTGVTFVHQGLDPGAIGGTATGARLLTREGNVLLDTIIGNVRRTGFVPVGRFFAAAALKYTSGKELAQILGGQEELPPKVLRDILQADYHVEVEAGASATSKDVELSMLMSANQSLAQVVNARPDVIAPAMVALTARALQNMGISDIAGYLYQVVAGGWEKPPAAEHVGAPRTGGWSPENVEGPREPTPEETPGPSGGAIGTPGGVPA
jgi:hypothetical protein